MQCLCSSLEEEVGKKIASEKEYEITFGSDWNTDDDIDETATP